MTEKPEIIYKCRVDARFLFLGRARSVETGQPVDLSATGNAVVRALSLVPAFALFLVLQQNHQAHAVIAGLVLLLVLLPFGAYIVGRFTGWIPITSAESQAAARRSQVFFRAAILLLALIFGSIWLLGK